MLAGSPLSIARKLFESLGFRQRLLVAHRFHRASQAFVLKFREEFTSKAQKADRIWGQLQGAKGHVCKPYTADQIIDQLKVAA